MNWITRVQSAAAGAPADAYTAAALHALETEIRADAAKLENNVNHAAALALICEYQKQINGQQKNES